MVGLLWVGCQVPEARKPVQRSSGSFIQESAERNKIRYEQEISGLEALIEQDSLHTYYPTEQGFWYYYQQRDTITSYTPTTGDLVEFTFAVTSTTGEVLISREENGVQQYKVDQSNQDLISGIRQGLKFMKAGEQVTFLFPSYFAYGYYGLQNRVGRNQPVYCSVELISITPDNTNNSNTEQ